MARRPFPFGLRLLGRVLAVFALYAQIAAVAAVPDCCRNDVQLLTAICGIDHPAAPVSDPSGQGHRRDCAVCPACAASAVHVATIAPAPLLPPPSVVLVRIASPLPPARGPPSRTHRPGEPRGPPVLV